MIRGLSQEFCVFVVLLSLVDSTIGFQRVFFENLSAASGLAAQQRRRARVCVERPALRLVTRLFSSEASEGDFSRWERMYQEGAAARQKIIDSTISSSSSSISVNGDMVENSVNGVSSVGRNYEGSEVRVVSFDLDNTLWKTSACINAANNALAAHLDSHSIQQPKRVENVMGELFRADPLRYSPLLPSDGSRKPSGPVLLTKLRIDATRQVLKDPVNGYSEEEAQSFAEEAFEVWTKARHDAIPHNLAHNVVECLELVSRIRSKSVSSSPQQRSVLIGAITDGNSNPHRVEAIGKYFDFCVNAEQVGICKPDKRIYLEAVRKVAELDPSALPEGVQLENIDEDDEFEVGPSWVHIGDDFVKDIVAAKSLKMRTVWATELIREKLEEKLEKDKDHSRSADDIKNFVEKISGQRVVEMAIGADSYLADSFTREFADVVIEKFYDLAGLLEQWNDDGIELSEEASASSLPTDGDVETTYTDQNDGQVINKEIEKILSVVMPDDPGTTGESIGSRDPAVPRAFRISRENYSMDVASPLQGRDTQTMKDVMRIAQLDKSSGVFAFPAEDVEAVRVGTKVLMIRIEETDLEFSKEIFSQMTIEEVLNMTDANPIGLTMYVKDAAAAPSFDIF